MPGIEDSLTLTLRLKRRPKLFYRPGGYPFIHDIPSQERKYMLRLCIGLREFATCFALNLYCSFSL